MIESRHALLLTSYEGHDKALLRSKLVKHVDQIFFSLLIKDPTFFKHSEPYNPMSVNLNESSKINEFHFFFRSNSNPQAYYKLEPPMRFARAV